MIKEIHPNAFKRSANLEIISFNKNKIEVIHENIFNGLTNLKEIYFFKNNLKELHPNIFNGLTNLEIKYFKGNPIKSQSDTFIIKKNGLLINSPNKNRFNECILQ